VRQLLDEMISATVAARLRERGHDAVAVQDTGHGHLRGIDDCLLLDFAAVERRALVTDNVPDVFRCQHRRLEAGEHHYGLLFFTNDTFPRHRHDLFVGRILVALERRLADSAGDDGSSWVRWLG
jgi:hypothetical protein